MSRWDDLRWFVVFNGIADKWLWGFEADGWELWCGNPAHGSLALMPPEGKSVATIEDARWLADALAFDHDAPVGIFPALEGEPLSATPKDPAATPLAQPIHPLDGPGARWYWDMLNHAYGAAAELRFNGSYVIRYDEDDPEAPSTDFSIRFKGREELVGLYAMAARQADLLSEYLCLYRVLEAADKGNGTSFAQQKLPVLRTESFGDLRAVPDLPNADYDSAPNVFDVYRDRACTEIDRLNRVGMDVPAHLYSIRNALAHGKDNVLTVSHGERFADATAALPIVKLLARIAVGP